MQSKITGKLYWVAKRRYIDGTLYHTPSGWLFVPVASQRQRVRSHIVEHSFIIAKEPPYRRGTLMVWTDDAGEHDVFTFRPSAQKKCPGEMKPGRVWQDTDGSQHKKPPSNNNDSDI